MKKILLITYYWPPCGGVSVQRWLKLTKYFPVFDWLPTVVTTENGDYPYIDSSLLEAVSSDIKVVRTKTPTFSSFFHSILGKEEKIPYGSLQTSGRDSFLKKVIFFIRTQLVSPDARMIWNTHGYNVAEKILTSGMYEAVITTGPPHSTHLIGLRLKKKFGIKWIADFRDPWTKNYYLESVTRNFIIKAIDKSFEKKVVSSADAVVAISEHCSQVLGLGNFSVILNGFDPDDFIDKVYTRSEYFRIKYIGPLYTSRLADFLKILGWINEYAQKNNCTNIAVSTIGGFEKPPSEIKHIASHLVYQHINFVEHQKAIEESVNSEVLLLIVNRTPNNRGVLTFKLYEYLGSQTIVLASGPPDSNVKDVLQASGGGSLFDYDDKEGFLNKFDTLYRQWSSGASIKNMQNIDDFSLPSICSQYSELLKQITK